MKAGRPELPEDAAIISRVRRRVFDQIRAQLRSQHVTIRASEGEWQEIAPGLHRKVLHTSHGALSALLRLAPGTVVQGHQHSMDEECIVLEGTLRIGADLVLRAGDFHVGRRGLDHDDASTETGALVYLRGAAEEAHAG